MIIAVQAVFLRMFIAHLLGDFYLQRIGWIEDKNKCGWKSKKLYLHSGLIAFITYLFLGILSAIWIIPVIFVTHASIDMLKVFLDKKCDNCLLSYVFDQILHIIVLVLITLFIGGHYGTELITSIPEFFSNPVLLTLFTAYLLIITPTGFLIKKILTPIGEQIKEVSSSEDSLDSGDKCNNLDNAGRKIGYLERILVLTFVLINQYVAIGFLITAKSIFRFRDNKPYLVEYYLLGTFLSMTFVIIIGLATVFASEILWPGSLNDLFILLNSMSTK